MQIKGNSKTLFSVHGEIKELSLALGKLEKQRPVLKNGVLDIDKMNRASDLFKMYVRANGVIEPKTARTAESVSRYLVVGTGLLNENNQYLAACFVNSKSSNSWLLYEFGTVADLFVFMKDFSSKYCKNFSNDYLPIFGGENRFKEPLGTTLVDIKKHMESQKSVNLLSDDYTQCINTSMQAVTKFLLHSDEVAEADEKMTEEDLELISTALTKCEEQTEVKEEAAVLETINTPKTELKNPIISSAQCVINNIYELLLDRSNWIESYGNFLNMYMKKLFEITRHSIDTEETDSAKQNGYTWNKTREVIVLNVGLMNTYGNDIYIVDIEPKEEEFTRKRIELIDNKNILVNRYGFKAEDIKVLPSFVKLVENPADYIFNGRIEDIDLDDTFHLNHIIRERSYRLPKKYSEKSEVELSNIICAAIEQAVRIHARDYRYIVPKLNFSDFKLQYQVPLHLDLNLTSSVDAVAIVGKRPGDSLYTVFTILEPETISNIDSRMLCLPTKHWIESNNTSRTKK